MTKEELKEQDIRLNRLCFDYQEKEKRIAELEAQIEEMKCCGNCAKYNSGYGENPCKMGASMICGEWETFIGKF